MSEFSVTTERDGSRSFGEHDDRDRWSRGGGGGGGGGKYRGGGGGYNNRGRSSYRGGRKSYSNYGSSRGSYNSGGYNSGSSYNSERSRGGSTYRGRGRGRGSYRDLDAPDPRSRLDDDGDDTMNENDDQGNKKRFTPYGRPSNRRSRGNYRGKRNDYNQSGRGDGGGADNLKRLGLPIDNRRKDFDNYDNSWSKIIIPWGRNAEKAEMLKIINNRLDTPFQPNYFHYEDKNAIFYVNDRHAADALRGISGRLQMPNGYKMTLLVKPGHPPNLPMPPDKTEKLKVCMSKRYDPATKALNLSDFNNDSDFSGMSMYLNKPQVMCNVVKVIEENIPEIVSLDLSNNRLSVLEFLHPVVEKTPDLLTLNLGHNRINHHEELRKLSAWKLTCLVLDGNNFCDKFNDQASYVSAIRNVFPKVLKLDGHDLPPPITFDIEARTDLPKSKESYFPNYETQTTVVKFLKDYLAVYDSDSRHGLSLAYHDTAMFSLSTAYNASVPGRARWRVNSVLSLAVYDRDNQHLSPTYYDSAMFSLSTAYNTTVLGRQASLAAYLEESRNLLSTKNRDTGRKKKMLKQGNHIVPQLCLLPKTCHDPNSFVVDVDFVSPAMMMFTVQGVFKEVETKNDKPPIRAFSRTFTTVPGGHSMQITNDMLTITNASPDQIQKAFKTPAPTPSSSPVPQTALTGNPFDSSAGATAAPGVPTPIAPGLTEVQQTMITSFMAESRMNTDWSGKCLAENGWDYAKAGQNFLMLQQQGKIPPEAFIK